MIGRIVGVNVIRQAKGIVKAVGKAVYAGEKQAAVKGKPIDFWHESAVKSYTDDLLSLGYSKESASNLAKEAVAKDINNWGRPISCGVMSRRYSDTELLRIEGKLDGAGTDAMGISQKLRAQDIAKENPIVAAKMKENPELFLLSQEEQLSKKILDDAFLKVLPNAFATMEYRGAVIPKPCPLYSYISKLKKGDTYKEVGYMWTSPNREYAFGNYASLGGQWRPSVSVRYNILLPKGSKMLCVDRANPETLLRRNSQFRVCNILKDEKDNFELFLEYLPQ